MSFVSMFLLAFAVGIDAFAVSVASGISIDQMRLRHALKIALFFGFFQGIMPLLGYLLTFVARDYIRLYDHWIAFVLLMLVGGHMIYGAYFGREEEGASDPLNLHVLLMLSLATSIDAFIVGMTLSLVDESLPWAVVVIGVVTFIMSFAGVYLGRFLGRMFETRLEALGGVILIGLGSKILIEHLFVGS